MNREAYGGVTDSFLKMGLEDAAGQVTYYHPTFLYESVWNLIGFIGLHFYSKRRKFDGEVFLLYVAWYGLGRSWIEGLRTDSLYLLEQESVLANLWPLCLLLWLLGWLHISEKRRTLLKKIYS